MRAARGLTLEALAERTGFTKGYLSKVENRKSSPPIATLVKIAQALDTEVADLLDAPTSAERNDEICIVRSWQREPVVHGDSSFGYSYAALAHQKHKKRMEPFVMVLPPDISCDTHFEHAGEEFLFVLYGSVEFDVKTDGRTKTWILSPGDSVYFNSQLPHRSRGLNGEAGVLTVIFRNGEGEPISTGAGSQG